MDEAGALDGDVGEVFSPDEAVMPMAVAEVLPWVPLVGLGGIVGAGVAEGVCGEDDGAGMEV
jgi:hypothetical protein